MRVPGLTAPLDACLPLLCPVLSLLYTFYAIKNEEVVEFSSFLPGSAFHSTTKEKVGKPGLLSIKYLLEALPLRPPELSATRRTAHSFKYK